MNILSKDYSPFGKFSIQIIGITIAGIFLSSIPMYFFGIAVGLAFIIPSIVFCIWGMLKQDRKLKEGYRI